MTSWQIFFPIVPTPRNGWVTPARHLIQVVQHHIDTTSSFSNSNQLYGKSLFCQTLPNSSVDTLTKKDTHLNAAIHAPSVRAAMGDEAITYDDRTSGHPLSLMTPLSQPGLLCAAFCRDTSQHSLRRLQSVADAYSNLLYYNWSGNNRI